MYGVPHVVCVRAFGLNCGNVQAVVEEPLDPEFLKSMGITENDVIDDKSNEEKCHSVCGRKVGCLDPAGAQASGDGKLLIFVKEKDKGDELHTCIYCKVVRLLIYGFMEAEDIM